MRVRRRGYSRLTVANKLNDFVASRLVWDIMLGIICKYEGCAKSLQSCLTLCDPWTVAHQAPLSMGFSRQEYWSGLPFPSPGDLPFPGMKHTTPGTPALQTDCFYC